MDRNFSAKTLKRVGCVAVAILLAGMLTLRACGNEGVREVVEPSESPEVPVGVVSDGAHEGGGGAQGQSHRELGRIVTGAPPAPALPDAVAKFADQIEVLLSLSDLGDPVASCRLVVGINRCAENVRNRRFTETVIRHLATGPSRNESALIEFAGRLQDDGGFCEGIDPSSLPSVRRIFENSKHRLSSRQKVVLVLMRSDGSLRRLKNRRSFSESGLYVLPQFVADNSLAFLNEGFAKKDLLALEGLILLHAPGGALAPTSVSVWMPDQRLFLRYSLLMYELLGADAFDRDALELVNAVASSLPEVELLALRDSVLREVEEWRRMSPAAASGDLALAAGSSEGLENCER